MKQKVIKITESQFKSILDESHSGINEDLMNDAKNIARLVIEQYNTEGRINLVYSIERFDNVDVVVLDSENGSNALGVGLYESTNTVQLYLDKSLVLDERKLYSIISHELGHLYCYLKNKGHISYQQTKVSLSYLTDNFSSDDFKQLQSALYCFRENEMQARCFETASYLQKSKEQNIDVTIEELYSNRCTGINKMQSFLELIKNSDINQIIELIRYLYNRIVGEYKAMTKNVNKEQMRHIVISYFETKLNKFKRKIDKIYSDYKQGYKVYNIQQNLAETIEKSYTDSLHHELAHKVKDWNFHPWSKDDRQSNIDKLSSTIKKDASWYYKHSGDNTITDKMEELGFYRLPSKDYSFITMKFGIDKSKFEKIQKQFNSILNFYNYKCICKTYMFWRDVIIVTLEAVYGDKIEIDVSDRIFYHATPSKNVEKILRQGLVPKDRGRLGLNRPDRIYLSLHIDKFLLRELGNDRQCNYTVLKIDLRNMPDITIYQDPYCGENGYYCTDNIPPTCISIVPEQKETLQESIFKNGGDLSEVGSIEYESDFDEDSYQEWLDDLELDDNKENLLKYYKEEVSYNLTYYDYYTQHYMDYDDFLFYSDLVDLLGQNNADIIIKDIIENGSGTIDKLALYSDINIDINNPQEVNSLAVKLFPHGRYYKNCRGFILTNGIIVYTPSEHNEILRIDGLKSKFDFIYLGNIRVLENGLDIGKKPTPQQEKVLEQIINSYSNDVLYIDLMDEHKGVIGLKYYNPDANDIIEDILNYYKNGIVPKNLEESLKKKKLLIRS